MLKLLCLLIAVISAPVATASIFDHESTLHAVQDKLNSDDPRVLADQAFDAMIKHAVWRLRNHLHECIGERCTNLANRLEHEWASEWKGYLLRVPLKDVGDHDPMSQWVADFYEELQALFGNAFLEKSHLKDIWVLNFTIPVVFNAKAAEQWCLDNERAHPTDTCSEEYRRHFAGTKWNMVDDPFASETLHHGFSGVVTYWVVWAACEAVSYGAGIVFICSPPADLSEMIMERYFATGISANIWTRNN